MPTDRETSEAERIEAARRLLASVDKHADASPLILTTIARDLRTIRPLLAAALTPAPPKPPAGMAEVERPDVAEMMWAVEDALDVFVDDTGTRDQLFDKICAVAEALRAAYRQNEALRAALASLRAEREVPEEWQDISTAPKIYQPIIVAFDNSRDIKRAPAIVAWDEEHGLGWCHWHGGGVVSTGTMTHWRPLPAPPRALISAQKEPRNG